MQKLIYVCVSLLFGFLLPFATVYGGFSPLGIAFASSAQGLMGVPVFLSTVIGYIVSGNGGALRYLAALVAIVGIRWSVSGFPSVTRSRWFAPVLTFISLLVTGGALMISVKPSLIETVTVFSESLLAAGFSYFCYGFFRYSFYELPKKDTSIMDLGIVVVFSTVMMTLYDVQWKEISLGRIFAVFCILSAANYASMKGGSIVGVTMAFTSFLSNPYGMGAVPLFAFGGFLSGIFSKKGRWASALSFVAMNCIVHFLSGEDQLFLLIVGIYEIVCATVLLYILPSSVSQQIHALFWEREDVRISTNARQNVAQKLQSASNSMKEVANTVDAISKEFSTIGKPSVCSVYQSVSEKVCKTCKNRMICWETQYELTNQSLHSALSVMSGGGSLDKEKMEGYLKENCLRLDSLCDQLNKEYESFLLRESVFDRIYRLRGIINDQFGNTAKILEEFAAISEKPEWEDKETVLRLTNALEKKGYTVTACTCCIKADKHRELEITFPTALNGLDVEKIQRLVERNCDQRFYSPAIERENRSTTLFFSEGQTYRCDIGVAQSKCKGEKLCGDSFEIFRDGSANQYIVLSDGMGCGGRAAVDGAMTAGIAGELLKAGFGYESILRLVNTALMSKADDETLATLDIACINLFTGDVEFLKAGAGVTLLISNSRLTYIGDSSLPLGILRELSFARTKDRLCNGDVLIMMSDGISNEEMGWLEELAKLFDTENGDVQSLANCIVDKAKKRCKDEKGDDMTALVFRLKKAHEYETSI